MQTLKMNAPKIMCSRHLSCQGLTLARLESPCLYHKQESGKETMSLWPTVESGEGKGGFQLVPVPRKLGTQGLN